MPDAHGGAALHGRLCDPGTAGRGRGGGAGGVHRTVRGAGAACKPQEVPLCAAAAALPLLQDEVSADGNGPGGDAPHRGRTEALPAENAPAGRQGRLGGRKGADRERQGLLQEAQRQRTLDSAAGAAQRAAKGEGSMRYVCHRRARFEGISGRVIGTNDDDYFIFDFHQ